MRFYKYQGTGNDFVMIDNRSRFFDIQNNQLVKHLCDRRFGIGADGLILLQTKPDQMLEMIYYNSDGNIGSMCGNGGRCFVQFSKDLGLFDQALTFDAPDGEHFAKIEQGLIYLKMINVESINYHENGDIFMNTGSPHHISFVKDLEQFDVVQKGKSIRYSEAYAPAGTNVNFIEIKDQTLWVRTYERGVEEETYSCGTGVTASALAANGKGMKSPIAIKTLGGNLKVAFSDKGNGRFEEIFLIGPAVKVYEGDIELYLQLI
ncbi:MAG: diaminopimelate epimerase [Cytophagales bacterium]|nr:MAG: diaminopimelate epimerase [Cytophagales bacterium]